MKKYIVLTLFLSTTTLYGQENKMRFGIKLGINSAQQRITAFKSNSPRLITFVAGGIIESPKLQEKLSLQLGIQYSQKGGGESKTSSSSYAKTTLNYLELPLNVLYYPSPKIALGIGPYLAYYLNGKIDGKPYMIDENTSLKQTDSGLSYQLQVEVAKKLHLTLNASSAFSKLYSIRNKTIGVAIIKSI
jgi:hypothetical protein